MLEQMKSVSNPLTIIALFAALAEIAGTVAIKLVAPEMQPTFIWFVMIFPTLIVVLFFVTLNFNAKVLYAPGDFRNEENYLAIQNAKKSLGIEEIRVMIGEAIPEIVSEVAKNFTVNGADERRKIEEVVQDKLRPVQSFAGKLGMKDYLFLSAHRADDREKMLAVWQLLHSESTPMTLKEIATKLNLHEGVASMILSVLIEEGIVKENLDKGSGKTYLAKTSPTEYIVIQARLLYEKEVEDALSHLK